MVRISPALPGTSPWLIQVAMGLAGMLAGSVFILVAGALRHYRGVNETISSLLLTSIAIAGFHHLVEGPLRDPASLNKPSTVAIGDVNMLGMLPGMDVHWGLVYGLVACVVMHVVMSRTAFGFVARIAGGNPRAAQLSGLPIGRLMLMGCFLAGAAAGLAGMVEVTAVHGRANASLIVGYGYTGILGAFLARHQPLAIIPVAVLLDGIGASGGLLQRRLGLPDATVLVLQGILFVVILAAEALRDRLQMTRYGVCCLPEEPLRNACVPRMSVAENLVFRRFDRAPLARGGWWLQCSAMARAAYDLISRYHILTPSPQAPIATLSGGNVQRTVLARALSDAVEVLIVANPCFGLDVAAAAEIRAQILAVRNRGAAVLLVSEDLDELLALSDRILVMSNGQIVYETPIQTADVATIGHHMAAH